MHVVKAILLQHARQIRDPGRRPVARDLGAARVIIGVNEKHAHKTGLQIEVSSARYNPK